MLPPDMKTTVSQSIAASQGRHMAESKLWNKIATLCEEACIPMGDEAPDFVVTISAPPTLGVFEIMPDVADDDFPRGIEQPGEEET